MWELGDQVVVRYWTDGRLSGVLPVTVVQDSPDSIAYYLAEGTPCKHPVDLDAASIPLGDERGGIGHRPWGVADLKWHTTSRLYLVTPGAAHAFSVFWRATDWSFLGWYVDLQAPLRRTRRGFESEDYLLDIVVAPDGSWKWKDEDEFEISQRAGRFSSAETAAIRAEAARVIERIEARTWPLDAGWEDWRPDPAWPIPMIPDGWNAVDENH
ncbi:MAG TPA: DUF402 domain-containing protein [Thermomicrobiaceae bacterium]|nr:DUF402 domain-containing protein [Thermomicrobiaceae bacterium]